MRHFLHRICAAERLDAGENPVNSGKRALFFCVVLLIVLRSLLILYREFSIDELQHLHVARSIASGRVIYKDFFEHHGPLLPLLLSPLHRLIGDRSIFLFVGRFMMTIWSGVAVWLIWLSARQSDNVRIAICSVGFLIMSPMFWDKGLEVRPDVLAGLGVLGWMVNGILSRSRNPRQRWLLAGLAASVTVLAAPKYGFIIAATAPVLMILWRHDLRSMAHSIKRFCDLLLGAAGPAAAVFMYLVVNDAVMAFIHRAFLINFRWNYRFSPAVFYGPFLLDHYPILILGIVGITLESRSRLLKAVFWSVGVVAAITIPFLVPEPFLQSFFPIILLTALPAGKCLDLLLKGSVKRDYLFTACGVTELWLLGWIVSRHKLTAATIHHFCFLLLLLFGLAIFGGDRSERRVLVGSCFFGSALVGILVVSMLGMSSNRKQIEMIEWVRRTVAPGETFMDEWTGYGVLCDHAYDYFFIHEGINKIMTYEEKEPGLLAVLQNHPPRLIATEGKIQGMSPRVADYINRHYRQIGKQMLREPRPENDPVDDEHQIKSVQRKYAPDQFVIRRTRE